MAKPWKFVFLSCLKNLLGNKKRVQISHGARVIHVWTIEVLLYFFSPIPSFFPSVFVLFSTKYCFASLLHVVQPLWATVKKRNFDHVPSEDSDQPAHYFFPFGVCSVFASLLHVIQPSWATVKNRNFDHVRLAKIQISLRIRAVWSESSLDAFCIAKDANFLHADNEDSNQTARMRRLIGVFVGCTCQKVNFRSCGSNIRWYGKVMCNDCGLSWVFPDEFWHFCKLSSNDVERIFKDIIRGCRMFPVNSSRDLH